jgi:8-oxo-dGTP pyrophosphatase MutT (NUDIX family)
VVEEAARRETLEETGLRVGGMLLFWFFSGLELFYRYPNGDEVYNVTIVYLSHIVNGNIQLNGEHTEWRWFAPADIPENLSSPIKPVIETFKASA